MTAPGRARRAGRLAALTAAVALVVSGCSFSIGDSDSTDGGSSTSTPVAGPSSQPGQTGVETFEVSPDAGADWVVLVEDPADTGSVADGLRDAGYELTSTNSTVGMVTLRSDADDVRETAEGIDGVTAAVTDRSVGWSPDDPVEPSPDGDLTPATDLPQAPDAPEGGDPFDTWAWGLGAINAFEARGVTPGRREVRVGVIDTGVDVSHPDLAPVLDTGLSKTFVSDIPDIDGECEHESCTDPVGEDGGGHGSHVAGTVAAAANDLGVSGVAPGVSIVDLRAGQDSGFFFLGPSVNALTYAGDQQLDVVNMSFYVDPWLYACEGGAPEDSAEEASAQDVMIELMRRAQDHAHAQGVTMIGSAGNSSADLADPGTDDTSPNYGADPHSRTIDADTCYDLPVEGPHVVGVSSVDESGERSLFSNWTSEPDDDEIEVAGPGGSGAQSPRGILSATPRSLARVEALVDDEGRLTEAGVSSGYVRDCPDGMSDTDPDPDGRCGLYTWAQGTSMASPHVAGTAALIISKNGDRMEPDAVAEALMTTAKDQPCPSGGDGDVTCVGSDERNGFVGEGIVDAAAAVR